MTPKPCIIRWRPNDHRYEAFNENGYSILFRRTYAETATACEHYGYIVLPPMSKWHQGLLGQIETRRGIALS